MIGRTNNLLPLKTQAELFSLSRSSLYYRPKAPSTQEVQAKRRIDEIYTAHPFLGSRKITVLLRKEMRISRPTVQRYMRAMEVTAIYPAPRLSQHHPEHKIYPYLLRNLVMATSLPSRDRTPQPGLGPGHHLHPPAGWLGSIWWPSWIGSRGLWSAGSLARAWRSISSCRRSTAPCCRPPRKSAILIRAVNSPARVLPNGSCQLGSR